MAEGAWVRPRAHNQSKRESQILQTWKVSILAEQLKFQDWPHALSRTACAAESSSSFSAWSSFAVTPRSCSPASLNAVIHDWPVWSTVEIERM